MAGNEVKEFLDEPVYARPGIILGDTTEPLLGIYEESSAQQYALGTKLVYNDGREFRYAKNGAVALVKAYMTQSEAVKTRLIDELQSTSGTSVIVGLYQITVDITTGITLAEDELADGLLLVNKATGIGDVYKIRASKVQSTDTLLDILLESPIRTAWAADTEITATQNKWRDVIVDPVAATNVPTGIPLIAVTANYYCWLQTKGYAPCYVDTSETLVVGEPAGYPATPNVAGACGPIGADTDAFWGNAVTIATAGEVAILDLALD